MSAKYRFHLRLVLLLCLIMLVPGLSKAKAGCGKDLEKLASQTDQTEESLSEADQKKVARAFADLMWNENRLPTLEEVLESKGFELSKTKIKSLGSPLKLVEEYYPAEIEKLTRRLARTFAQASKAVGRPATLEEVAEKLGTSIEELDALISEAGLIANRDELKALAQELFPKLFEKILDTDVFNDERMRRLVEAVRTHKRIVVTTAVSGTEVVGPFLKSLELYAKEKDATVIVIPANMVTNKLDPSLLESPDVHVLTNSMLVNDGLLLDTIKVMAKQLNPTTGLEASFQGIHIIGSPKMHSKSVEVAHGEGLHRIYTTGAITKADYAGKRFISARTDKIAEKDHRIGAVVLEKVEGPSGLIGELGRGDFNVRHIEYIPEKEGFADLDEFFSAKGKVTSDKTLALVLGDLHADVLDQSLFKTLGEQIKELHPEFVVIHDLLDAMSISHHEREQLLTLAGRADRGELNLEREFDRAAAALNAILAADPSVKIVVVDANHNEFTERWLEAGRFSEQAENTRVGLELSYVRAATETEGVRTIGPLEYALLWPGIRLPWDRDSDIRPPRVDEPSRVVFLRPGQSFKIGPDNRLVELGFHGDVGKNGARVSLKSMERAFGRAVYGHTHSTDRRNDVVNVGTFTKLLLKYNARGTSTWSQSMVRVGANGELQILDFVNGQWYDKSNDRPKDEKASLGEDYPQVLPNNEYHGEEGQVDQWSEWKKN